LDVSVRQYKSQIEELAEKQLRDYIKKVKKRSPPLRSPKEVNDTVWQTIVLFPFEVIILDCYHRSGTEPKSPF